MSHIHKLRDMKHKLFVKPKENNKFYMIIFNIDEYWSYYIYGVLEIKVNANIKFE